MSQEVNPKIILRGLNQYALGQRLYLEIEGRRFTCNVKTNSQAVNHGVYDTVIDFTLNEAEAQKAHKYDDLEKRYVEVSQAYEAKAKYVQQLEAKIHQLELLVRRTVK